MTYDDYLDGTSKMAIQALVLELDEAVRGAAEKAVAPAVDQVHASLRRLTDSDEALRRELAELATRLPAHMQGVIEPLIARAAEPAWQGELKEAVKGGLAAQYERLSEASDAIRRNEEAISRLAAAHDDARHDGEAASRRFDEVERSLERMEARLQEAREAAARAEQSLLAGVLERETRLTAEVRQVMQEVIAEGVAPAVRAGVAEASAPLAERIDKVESTLGQVREECQTRHDAVVRMLDNLNGRVVFDVEAQNKNAYLLERLRRQGRWQMALSVVMLGAVGLLFAFTFVQRTGMLNRF